VLILEPTRHETHYNLALILEQAGDLAGAERHYRESIRLFPGFAGAHNNLAIVLYTLKRYPEAWQHVRRAQSLGAQPHPSFLDALQSAHPE
jgi:Flp pilus assembly protein TadD